MSLIQNKYWSGLEELHNTPEFEKNKDVEFPSNQGIDEFLGDAGLSEVKTGRRDFLKFLGFSVAAATLASCESPAIKSIPYVFRPEDVTPGIANWYASAFYDGNDYAGILIKTREGRPIHIKGNKHHGFTKGGSNPRIIASVLSLYDSERLQGPLANGAPSSWDTVDSEIIGKLRDINKKGGNITILSNTIISPSLQMAIQDFATQYGGASAATAQGADAENAEGDTEAAAAATPVSTGAGRVNVVQYDPVSYSGMRRANQKTFGKSMIPVYDFSKAKVIVSVGADFLGSWLMSTAYVPQYAAGRNPESGEMSRHFQFESLMSIAGASADVRRRIKPSEQGTVVAALLDAVGGNGGVDTSSLDPHVLDAIKVAGEELKANRGNSLVIAGDNDESVQILVNAINAQLGNYGANAPIDNTRSLNMYASDDAEVEKLANAVATGSGKPDALLIVGVNPVYSLPNGAAFGEGLKNIGLTVSFSTYADETAAKCAYVCPDNHYLESWADYNPVDGHYAVGQPVIRPLYNTATFMESMLVWGGKAGRADMADKGRTEHNYIKTVWEKYGWNPESDEFDSFESYWSSSVMKGSVDNAVTTEAPAFNGSAVSGASSAVKSKKSDAKWQLALYQKSGMGVGNHANNPWLQEMPDPISKVTWDNYITLAPKDMEAQGFSTYIGQENPASVAKVKVGDVELELPVIAQPGQAEGTIGVAVGYGRGENGEKIGKAAYHTGEYGAYEDGENGGRMAIGKNAFRLAAFRDGLLRMDALEADLSSSDKTYPLAATQTHHTVMGRHSIVRETTLSFYKTGIKERIYDEENKKWVDGFNRQHTMPVHADVNGDGKIDSRDQMHINAFDLWDEHPVELVGHRWGMTIDLNSCIGCGSCLIACQSENNVPVVGKDEIRRVRDMFWLRLDRYYSSDQESVIGSRKDEWSYAAMERPEDNPKVVFMPVMCQHCNHAPCETVCPVVATTHSNEGLNQMTYNRCIGTRYCANNCPYKVRRFNWFSYPQYKKFTAANPAQDSMSRMVLNPDVTVRTRGVMEKCSMCVQRIQEGKLKAKKDQRPVVDGDAITACADACPSNAIIFGDLNDMPNPEKGTKGSAVRQSADSNRSYHMLEEIGTRPNIYYKVKVRNISEESQS
jgi:MoCo/4Fe-4S cofactor protein with predicted Tat translocation signal